MTMYEQSQQSDWLQTELESMSLQEASPAKTLASQETRQEYKTEREAVYGQSAPVYLGTFDLNTPSLKTSQTCLMDTGEIGLSEYCGTFPRSGMMRSGTVYQLPNLARTITEIGSGLLPTPAASTGGTTGNWKPIRPSGHRAQLSLQQYARMFPTPTASDSGSASKKRIEEPGHPKAALREAVFWPTPTAHNAKEGAYPAEYERNTPTLAAQAGGKLNPMWVEWLMGFPLGHTDLNA